VSLFPDIGPVPALILFVLLAGSGSLLWISGRRGRGRDTDLTLRVIAGVLWIAALWVLWSNLFYSVGVA
jgi:hypothetical protein